MAEKIPWCHLHGADDCTLWLFSRELGSKAVTESAKTIRQMLLLLPPIFIMLGLMDVWVPRETMIRLMGEKSGMKGVVIAFLLGSFTAGPLYGAFPVATVLMKKGVKFSNVLVFIGAWSTTKIPMLLFEGLNLAWPFALTRLAVDIPGIIIIATLISLLTTKEEKEELYRNAEQNE
jgi:Predicted permeases